MLCVCARAHCVLVVIRVGVCAHRVHDVCVCARAHCVHVVCVLVFVCVYARSPCACCVCALVVTRVGVCVYACVSTMQ